MEIDLDALNNILTSRKVTHLRTLMEKRARQYHLSSKDLVRTTKKDIIIFATKLNEKHNSHQRKDAIAQKWMWGEYRLFVWLIIYFAEVKFLEINAITQHQFQNIREVFPLKKSTFLYYEYTLLFCFQNDFTSNWHLEELQLLEKLLEENKHQWKTISYQLFKLSGGAYCKSAESCRNRWENHCNPSINKGEWTTEEDAQMIKQILMHGKRWACIAKLINSGRTEHMIKNRFRCLLKKMKISEKGSTFQQSCIQILQNIADKFPEPDNKLQKNQFESSEGQNTTNERDYVKEEKSDSEQELEGIHAIQEAKNQDYDSQSSEAISTLKIDELISVLNEREFGQNHIFMNSLDIQWLQNLSNAKEYEDIVDIGCF